MRGTEELCQGVFYQISHSENGRHLVRCVQGNFLPPTLVISYREDARWASLSSPLGWDLLLKLVVL